MGDPGCGPGPAGGAEALLSSLLSHQDVLFFFRYKNSLLSHNQFSTLFFSMKEAESGEIVIVSCIIDFKDRQLIKTFYDGFLEIFRPNFEEDHLNFAGLEIQAKMS